MTRAVANQLGIVLVACVVSSCENDVITAQETSRQKPAVQNSLTSAELAKMSDRELLIALLGRLDALERRMGGESSVASNSPTILASQGGGSGNGQGSGQGHGQGNGQGNGNDPQGVPHKLDELAARIEVLNDKLNDLIVGIGLPKPPDSDMSDSELFQTSSKVCFSLGGSIDTKLTGAGKVPAMAEGTVGIDFYGNKMTIGLGGHGQISGEVTASPIKAAATYSFCVDARRQEAQAVIAALPFTPSEFESRFQSLANDVKAIRTSPFKVIDPSFRLFGMAEGGYPSATEMVNRVDDFFRYVKGPICNKIKSRFDIISDLNLGQGTLGGIVSPAASKLQDEFNSKC